MSRRSASLIVILLLTVVALAVRLPALGNRPMHADESVHTVKFAELWKTGRYHYDYNEYHGPTIYYAALPVVALRGRQDFAGTQESDYRLPIAFAGGAMLLWLLLLTDGLGRPAASLSALLLALSPAFVFYSRYYIQETFLAFFTLGLIACGWRYTHKPSAKWAILGGICGGLMMATKETAVLTFVAMAAALLIVCWQRKTAEEIPWRLHGRYLGLAAGTSVAVAGLVLSGFFTHPLALLDYLHSFTPWLQRAHGTNLHPHPWDYYLRLLLWPATDHKPPLTTEALILVLAILGATVGWSGAKDARRGVETRLLRFLAIYTLILTGIYSVIPYKTPWCVLTFWQGMILLAGVGTVTLVQKAQFLWAKVIVAALLLAGFVHLGWQSYLVSFVGFADTRNPYVYSPTARETVELPERLAAIAQASPEKERTVIKIFSMDGYYWPLPWYLRRFPNIGYWTGLPRDVDAPIILSSSEFDDELTKRLDRTHLMTGYFALRPGVLMQIWVRLDLWQQYIKTRRPSADD